MFLAQTTTTVHTAGINWESVITIIGSVVTILAVVGALVSRAIGNKITAAIHEFQIAVIDKLDTRLTQVEDKLDDIRNTTRRRQ